GPAAVRLTGTAFGAEGLFVANFFNDSVNVFPFGEFGNVSPIRIIGGAKTGLNYPYGLALDAKGTIYIANLHGGPDSLGSVTVYRAGSNGNAAPMLNIAGDKTGLNYPWGIAVDSKGKIYVANIGPCCEPSCGESITIYSPHANGNVAPIATIPADATTQLNAPYGMTFDSKGNLWVADYGGGPSGVGAITAYPAGASGEVAPIVNITGDRAGDSNAGLFGTAAVTFDSKGDIFATNGLGANVTVYSAGSNGNATPVATIGGGNTGFSVAEMNIMLDNAGNIYIANQQFGYDVSHPSAIDSWSNGGGFIEIFPPGSNGNVAYTNAIQGDNTYMNGPWGFAFGPIDR
ncbi:MAG TPA: hypothetical protein VMU16_15560, partial [Candidatus Binataceae bacterium]|nr:hypothetical protein [Candidatus Binataceae bacterium]